MHAGMWAAWAEMSIDGRDKSDPDVAELLHLIAEDVELERLHRENRLGSLWVRSG